MGRRDEQGDNTDGIRIKRDVLRRVVSLKLESLLRGDFYVRNHLGEDSYDPIVTEVKNFSLANTNGDLSLLSSSTTSAQPPQSQQQQSQPQQPPQPPPFSDDLDKFIQIIAASIMIDASMRGENAGESDPRFIKKKKKLLAKTLKGPKFLDFRKEILRFDQRRRGGGGAAEQEDSDEVSLKSGGNNNNSNSNNGYSHTNGKGPKHASSDSHGSASSEQEDDDEDGHDDSHLSDTSATSLSRSGAEDGFSTSATSSKHHHKKKKEKKRRKKEKKEKKRRERRERKEKRKREKEKQKKLKESREESSKSGSKSKKRRKQEQQQEDVEEETHDAGEEVVFDSEAEEEEPMEEEPVEKVIQPVASLEFATKEEFEKHRDEILSRVSKDVKSRFREGGFSKWGGNMLPVLEIGPFDVEPGPVREMWMDMYHNTRKSGREMTRLVFWYGVKFEDRGQAYSFVPAAKIMTYEEGEKKGFCEVPKKIKKKLNDKKKLTKTEEQISRGLKEITGDMKREKKDRIKWMMKFQEDWELPDQDEEEEDEVKSPEPELKPKKVKKLKVEEIKAELEQPIKRKPGRPRKVDKEREERERSEKLAMLERAEKATKADKLEKATKADKPEKATKADKSSALQKTKKKSTAKKFVIIDEDQEFDEDSDDDNDDRSYNDNESSDDNADDAEESDGSDDSNRRLNKDKESRKRKADSDGKKAKKKSKSEISEEMGEDAVGKGMKKKTKSETSAEGKEDTDEKKVKKKPKSEMTEEEKEEQVIRERERQAMYRENRKRKKAEALGLEYVPGERLQAKKSKKKIWQEEQSRFAECEEIFIPIMEQLQECKDKPNVEGVLKCIGLLLDQVEMLTPPFLHSYSLGMLVKDVRKTFEGSNPAVKDQCKRLTNEMKRVYTDKEKDLPDDFVPKKRKKHASSKDGKKRESISDSDPPIIDDSTRRMKVESEVPTDPSYSHTDRPVEQTPQNNAEMSHVDQTPSADLPVSSVKLEMPKPSRQVFSLKGMFEKPKPTPKPKITPNVPVSGQLSYKPKTLPSWVTGPATKAEEFHEQHTKERNFALEFFVDAVSPSSSDKFDAVSVSRAFELAIFAETKLRGRDWKTYWEKVHDVVAMLSPGKNQSNAIMQGIIDGDYQDPSELVKLSRREIHSLNQRRVK